MVEGRIGDIVGHDVDEIEVAHAGSEIDELGIGDGGDGE